MRYERGRRRKSRAGRHGCAGQGASSGLGRATAIALAQAGADVSEDDTPESFIKRQQLVRLLVGGITLGRDEDGETTVEVTYRFGPPKSAEPALSEDYGELEQADDCFVGIEQNSGPREAEKIFRSALSPPALGTRKLGWA